MKKSPFVRALEAEQEAARRLRERVSELEEENRGLRIALKHAEMLYEQATGKSMR